MTGSVGPLVSADEGFNHQAVETFASVSVSDPAWAEKVCGMAASIDGLWQIAFGFGKYTNRNVVDAYAGITTGKQQWTVRASRSLSVDSETLNVGPIHYEICKPLQSIRVQLESNPHQPIAFDIVFDGVSACVLEQREDRRDSHGYRKSTDQIRYHQSGLVSGWFEVNGERHDILKGQWVSTRDHSWGIRPSVGLPASDVEPDVHRMIPQVLAIWNPIVFSRQDGTYYSMHHYSLIFEGSGFRTESVQGGFEDKNGITDVIREIHPQLTFSSPEKRLSEGRFDLVMADGGQRSLSFKPLSDIGFYLGAGHYHGGDGHNHGSWRGELFVDGDYVEDNSQIDVITRYGQFRDCMIVVEDLVGGGIGYGNCQTYVHGCWPSFGLSGQEPMF